MPICIWIRGHASVCMSLLEIRSNNFWRNEHISEKFSGPVQLHTSNIWAGVLDHSSSRYGPDLKITCFFKIYLLPELLSHKDVTSGNLGAGDKKNRELTFLFLGRVVILGFEYVVTHYTRDFLQFGIFAVNKPTTIKFWEHFMWQ